MNFNPLEGISPIDGRYRSKVTKLADYFSEKALIQYRVKVEVLYFISLYESEIPQLKNYDPKKNDALKKIYQDFSLADAEAIKEIEKTTNHDVKAVEYFLKEKFDTLGLSEFKEFIHFGLTSQDINNTSIPLSLKDALTESVLPKIEELILELKSKAERWVDIPMLAKTHGQPASPTRLGKEINVFVVRLREQLDLLKQVPFAAKFGGATGNFNAHTVAYPDKDWHSFGDKFVSEKLGLKRSHPTTQIEHYDHLAALFDGLKRINTILTDFSRDVWQYISMGYFTQTISKNEVGSSAMPHKVNPIDFENAEGNLGIANALFEHLSAKLPISRLQRDLTDSTVLRNIGVPIAHSYIALLSLEKGLSKINANENAIKKDLEENWAVVAEAIQTILRREGYPKPYEALKTLTRTNEAITEKSIQSFIDGLNVTEAIKKELRVITPYNYTGR
ncbi:MAG: adenylosuccinate lyase [Ekhidna sp.]|uniref:adenylosuccinate lyase n=1 Tax=Ekhidna sp. TaxID=2608089 RepID=UPI0032EF789B